MSPKRMFLSSSFTSSMPGGTMTSTTYLPAGSIGVPVRNGSVVSGFAMQPQGSATDFMWQFDSAAMPVVGSVAVTLGNLYMPSYGAGCAWFSMDQPSKHLYWALLLIG